MNLPFVIDVAIGLIFIYLLLSLLASELQELIATLLQWRAWHLKQSIEILLSGGIDDHQDDVRGMVKQLYEHPLLKNLNQQAKEGAEINARRITSWLIPGNRKGSFGSQQASGPSYIFPETFATVLLEHLKVPNMLTKLTEVRLEQFAQRIVGSYVDSNDAVVRLLDQLPSDQNWQKGRIRLIAEKVGFPEIDQDPSYQTLVEDYDEILRDFYSGQATLNTCVERMAESLDVFVESYASDTSDETKRTLVDRLRAFKTASFGANNERAVIAGGLRPSLVEIAELVNTNSTTYREIETAYQSVKSRGEAIAAQIEAKAKELYQQREGTPEPPASFENQTLEEITLYRNDAIRMLLDSEELTSRDRRIYDDYQLYSEIKDTLNRLPKPVRESLDSLSRRAQTRAKRIGNELHQFQEEISLWFDRSMSRSSGVYKRNAKGFGLILGFLLAAATNSDAFHIADQLSRDESLRKVVTENATEFGANLNQGNQSGQPLVFDRAALEQAKNNADDVLRELSLPVGWTLSNLSNQFDCPRTATVAPGTDAKTTRMELYKACLGSSEITSLPVWDLIRTRPVTVVQMFFGWVVSAIGIAMGAPFWFDLLGKFINVRNAGSRPPSRVDGQTPGAPPIGRPNQ